MIYDSFMFSGEDEILEIRLHELDPVVDRFVIGSCEYSHSGIRKGINRIPENLMSKFGDKITFVEIPYEEHIDPWYNEMKGRQYVYSVADRMAENGDSFLVCDLDEIPKAGAVQHCGKVIGDKIAVFSGEYYMFCFDLYGRKSIDGFLIKKRCNYQYNMNTIRHFRTDISKTDLFMHPENTSWHFSSVGTPERILAKMKYFAHANECPKECLDLNWIKQCIKEKRGSISMESKPDETKLVKMTDESHPKYLVDNQERFKHLLYRSYE